MKRHISLLLLVLATLPVFADLNGNGYYRVQNYRSTRWISMIDDKGSIDLAATSVDLQAIRTQKDFDFVIHDPASVLYLTQTGTQFNIVTQGTDMYRMIGHYLTLESAGSGTDGKTYFAKGTKNGAEKYISDGGNNLSKDIAYCVTSGSGDWRRWYIKPISTSGDNYFGILPTIEASNGLYTSMLAGFPFKPYSDGVKVFAIKEQNNQAALAEEISGNIPSGTPVIFQCKSMLPTNNRLEIGGTGNTVAGNKLKGAYFCAYTVKTHQNFIEYNPETMRVPGKCSDGTFGFVKDEDLKYIPANTCYLTVAPDASDEIKVCFTRDEYTAGIEGPEAEGETIRTVYNLQGLKLFENATPEQLQTLPHGIYIISGKKVRL